jgi:hypothetical protein
LPTAADECSHTSIVLTAISHRWRSRKWFFELRSEIFSDVRL